MARFKKLHVIFTFIMLILLVPACVRTHILPDSPGSVFIFMLGWVAQSIACAALLYQVGTPGAWKSLATGAKRFLLAPLIPLIILPNFGLGPTGWLLCFVSVVVVEFQFRGARWRDALSALLPWLYLTITLQVMLGLNAVIVSVRPINLYDPFFQRLDWTLFHLSIQHFAHTHFASALYIPADAIYYSMPGFMGAALLFLCLAGDRTSAWDFAGSIAVAYYISLIVFFILPAKGPYSLDPIHLPASLPTASVQYALNFNARTLYHHSAWISSAFGYFISFPSMHIVQPLLAGWYLRRWKRVSALVFVYCAFLVASIFVLEWHYAVDIVGGFLVAIAAAWLAPLTLGKAARPLVAQTDVVQV